MKRSKRLFVALLGVAIIIGATNTVSAATWGVSNGDELKFNATKYTDNQFIIDQTISMTVTFNVTYVGDYVTADMSEDDGAAFSVFLNTQSLDDNFGINIRTSNGINIRYIADDQRIQSQMNQITNAFEGVLTNFVISRVGNNVIISAYGSGSETSWTYDAKINYTSDYVLNSMSEDHFQTDGANDAVQTVLWTNVYHHSDSDTSSTTTSTTSSTSSTTTPAPGMPTTLIIGAGAVVAVGVIVAVVMKRR